MSLQKCVQEDVDASMSNRLIDLRETVHKSYTVAISLFVEVKCEPMLITTQVREDVSATLLNLFRELPLDTRQKVSSQRLSDYLLFTDFVPAMEERLGESY